MKIYTAMNDIYKLNIEPKKQIAEECIQYGFIYLDFESRQRQTICCLEIMPCWLKKKIYIYISYIYMRWGAEYFRVEIVTISGGSRQTGSRRHDRAFQRPGSVLEPIIHLFIMYFRFKHSSIHMTSLPMQMFSEDMIKRMSAERALASSHPSGVCLRRSDG